MTVTPKPYNPTGAPFANGERDDQQPRNVGALPSADGARADDDDAAYSELLAFISANKDEDTEVSFLPLDAFREGR